MDTNMSVRASAENLSTDNQNSGEGGNMCLELALEGERLCKAGDCRAGVAFFQAAIKAGTDDLRTLSAIYSQLGNAYFYLGDYLKAMQYHKHDLTLASRMFLVSTASVGNARLYSYVPSECKQPLWEMLVSTRMFLVSVSSQCGKSSSLLVCSYECKQTVWEMLVSTRMFLVSVSSHCGKCSSLLVCSQTMKDKLGEAKSSGNLGNTLKVMGKFDEAMICCKRHLEIAQELKDKLSEGRALYNLGNIYHAKGKHIGRTGQQDPGEFPEDVRSCLQQAVQYYEENLQLMRELNETAAQGRACGNLGNTYYLLGNFKQAIHYHEERLKIAREFGDKAAERRANSNLGNSHIFLGEFDSAADHYKRTLVLAQELGDRAVEAQACYSLGNTYTLLRDYSTAIDYHLRHLIIAQQLMDRVGEGREVCNEGGFSCRWGYTSSALTC
uniref:(California timema) hypothetical protein n=1 Tax=Timema californicum TaxID=61474 RepID=A0A7R9JCB7_TIMCA|nr:unnamed protein product [Timema californicum]